MSLRLALPLAAILLSPVLAPEQDVFENADRIVAVGDVHGDFKNFTEVLRAAGVVDSKNKWKGGKTYLVQTGDIVDRGADSRKVLDLLMDLEGQAKKAGGAVHVLIGNHEAMNIFGDLRYVSAGEFAAFRTSNSEELRSQVFESQNEPARVNDPVYRGKWEEEHPLGWVEHRQAFGSNGKYGRWLRERNAVVKVNDALFVHGGISPQVVALSIGEINQRIRSELKGFTKLKGGLVVDPEGPLWYRGFSIEPEEPLAEHVDKVLAMYGVQHIVVGHTPTVGAVMPHFKGKVFVIDVGLSLYYGASPACLVIEGNRHYAIHRGAKIEIPVGTDNIRAYLRNCAAQDPPNTRLRQYLSGADLGVPKPE